MVVLGKEMGIDEKQIAEAGMGGLVHDLSKAMIPMDVLKMSSGLRVERLRFVAVLSALDQCAAGIS